jgi:hypothetical protein
MVDFDAIRERIADAADRVLFDEAVTCHQGGANRAAYVFAWIAAAEGLLTKLDAMGAAQADIAKFVKTFKADQATGTAKDATLLDHALKVGFVDPTEFKALNAVRDLRNQYGHPTAAAPSATTAAAAIELAVDAVLSKPALLQHGGARQLAERLGTDPHFLPADTKAIADWTVARAPLIADGARPLFIRTLVAQHAANLGQIDETLAERCLVVAATALAEWGPDLTDGRWDVDALQQSHGPSAAALFSTAGVWELLGKDDQYRILSRCLEIPTVAADPKLTNLLLTRAFSLHAGGTLNDVQTNLVAERVQAIDGSWLVSAGAPVDLLLAKAAGFLNDNSFETNKSGTRILEAIEKPALTTAGESALADAGAALARAARRNAFVAINLVADVVRQPDDWPQPFRIALAVEGAIEPWFFYNETTSRDAMYLGLHDVDVAKAVLAAIPQSEEKSHVGYKAGEVITSVNRRIDEGVEKMSEDAVPVVREILAVVAARYRTLYGEDEA